MMTMTADALYGPLPGAPGSAPRPSPMASAGPAAAPAPPGRPAAAGNAGTPRAPLGLIVVMLAGAFLLTQLTVRGSLSVEAG